MSELIKSWSIVAAVIAFICMITLMAQGNHEAAGYCVGVLMVCAVILADFYIIDEAATQDREEDQ